MLAKLQYISQGRDADEQLKNMQEALNAGCRWIQLRFKHAPPHEIKALAQQVKELCASKNAVFIVNDHPQIAQEVDADGVHLGLDDMPVEAARKIMGDEKIIGGTANTFEHILQRHSEGCDYIGLGPFRFTTTKEKLSPILGKEGYALITEKMQQHQIATPVFAIGGIGLNDVASIMRAGVYGIAVSGEIATHSNKTQIVQQINSLLYAEAYDS